MGFHDGRRKRAGIALLLLLAGCAAESPTPAPVQRARVREERTAEPSPAVKALLEEDPDLDRGMTPDDIRAALAAAKQHDSFPAPSPAPSPAGAEASGPGRGKDREEWSQLEEKQKAQLEAYRQRLESTIVQAGSDGAYHSAGCEVLYQYVLLKDGSVQRIYTGRSVTLGHSAKSGMSRHATCGAPTAEFSYR